MYHVKSKILYGAYFARHFIDKNNELLNVSEKEESLRLVAALSSTIENGTRDEILAATDILNHYTKPFAERLMDMAVAQALKGKSIEK